MSHRTQPVFGAQGSTRKVEGSAIIRKSAAPCISGMAKPPPGVNTGNTVRCEVSFASSVVVMETPFRISFAACDATTVLPRSTPCWSANEKRTSSSASRSAFSISRARRCCSSLQRLWRSTKLGARRGDIDLRLATDMTGGTPASGCRANARSPSFGACGDARALSRIAPPVSRPVRCRRRRPAR